MITADQAKRLVTDVSRGGRGAEIIIYAGRAVLASFQAEGATHHSPEFGYTFLGAKMIIVEDDEHFAVFAAAPVVCFTAAWLVGEVLATPEGVDHRFLP